MTLRLDGPGCTLLLRERPHGIPDVVHWGARLPDVTPGEAAAARDPAVPRNWLDEVVPLASLWPMPGAGLFQAPALRLHGRAAPLRLAQGEVTAGDPLVVLLRDPGGEAIALWLGLRDDVLTMRSVFAGAGEIGFLAAGVFCLPAQAREILTLGGRWGGEFHEERVTLSAGSHVVENRRGRTSHDRFPLLIAGTSGFGEESGSVWGVHLGWSGNHRTVAERLPDASLQVLTGELVEPGEASLPEDGPSLASPTAYAAFSDQGLSGLARTFHAGVRRMLTWPGGAMSPRPVTLNTWEGTYFAHDEARLMRQAEAAATLGIERFVLDDGWQKGRTSDRAGLGDWVVDPTKYPHGLGPLARHVTSLGMQFGLWVEPEMANPDSDALRARPDSVLRGDQRTARHQLVRDLTDPATWTAIHAALDLLLRELPIAYLKWDMNRDLVATADAQGRPATRRQVLATYALMDRLRADHPHLEIESCASGGGRADLGALARTHRVWTSDCTDALDRLRIQRGALRLLPPEILGAHVSASPNHQTGRRHTLGFRAAAALFFHFGIELDPLTLTAEEGTELAGWIALHKRLRPLLHAGAHHALDPVDHRHVLGVVAEGQAAYLVTQEASPAFAVPAPLRLPGLDERARYRVTAPPPQTGAGLLLSATHERLFAEGLVFAGGLLRHAGFTPPPMPSETALVLYVTREG